MKSVTETLKSLIASHGEDIIQQPQRIKAMLADLLPHEKRIRYLLEVSLRAEIPAKLKDIQQDEKELRETKTNALKHYFKEEYFLEDNAVKSVFDCWVDVIKCTLTKPVIYSEPVTDIDGNVYKTVQIGNQIWMAENLRVSRYRNGELIPNVTENKVWFDLKSGAWCNYENNPDYDLKFGKLYNTYCILDKREIAPEGWHVPSDEEWEMLFYNLGGNDVGANTWIVPNLKITNVYGFNGQFAGYWNIMSNNDVDNLVYNFRDFGRVGSWFSKRFQSIGGKSISSDTELIRSGANGFNLSVRCVKYVEKEDINYTLSNDKFIKGISEDSDRLIPYRKDNKWGFCTKSKSIIIPCEYDRAKPFVEGVAGICINKKWGLINLDGEIIVPCEYDEHVYTLKEFTFFSNYRGYTSISIYNIDGKDVVLNSKYECISDFYENKAMVRLRYEGKWGFVNKDFKEVIPCIYDNVNNFSEGLALVELNGKWGLIDIVGNEVVSYIYNYVNCFSENLAAVSFDNYKFGYINKSGKLIIPCIFDFATCFSNGFALVRYKSNWDLIDTNGIIVSNKKLRQFSFYIDLDFKFGDLISFNGEKKYGFLDNNLEEAIPCKFEKVGEFSEGLALVKFNSKWGFIDIYGNEITPFKYDGFANDYEKHYCAFHGGLAFVQFNGKWGYVDKNGNEYWEDSCNILKE